MLNFYVAFLEIAPLYFALIKGSFLFSPRKAFQFQLARSAYFVYF